MRRSMHGSSTSMHHATGSAPHCAGPRPPMSAAANYRATQSRSGQPEIFGAASGQKQRRFGRDSRCSLRHEFFFSLLAGHHWQATISRLLDLAPCTDTPRAGPLVTGYNSAYGKKRT